MKDDNFKIVKLIKSCNFLWYMTTISFAFEPQKKDK